MRILLRSLFDFWGDDGPILAGAISCFSMLAFVPFFLFLVSMLGFVLGQHGEFHDFFLSQVFRLFPRATHQITKELETIVGYREIGFFTLLVYGLFSYQLFVSLEIVLGRIFRVKVKRSLFSSVFLSFLTVTLLMTLAILSFGATGIISLLAPVQELFPRLKMGMLQSLLLGLILPLFLVFVVTTALYLLLPRRQVLLSHAAWGGLFAAVFLEAANHIFTFYMAVKISRLGAIYGSLTAVVTFLMWLFYSSSVLLVGAELVRNIGEEKRRSPSSPPGRADSGRRGRG